MTIQAQTCDSALKACDEVVELQREKIELQDLRIRKSDIIIKEQSDKIISLESRSYFKWIFGAIGFGVGGYLGIVLGKKLK